MAEKLAFDKLGGDGGAVDLDKRSGRTGAFGMQPTGHQFLAGAVLAGNQHARVAGRNLVDELPHLPDTFRSADNLLGVHGMGPARAARRSGGGFGRRVVDGAVNRPQQPVHVDGLGKVIAGSAAHRLDRRINGRLGREDDERNARIGDLAARVGENDVERNLTAHLRRCGFVLDRLGRETLVFEPLAQRVSHTF